MASTSLMRVGDRIGGSVVLGGVDVSAAVESFTVRLGFDMRVAECDINFALTPSFSDWATLVVKAGLTNSAGRVVPTSGLPTAGPSTVRFNGLAVNNGVTHWVYQPNLAGRGWLTLADRLKVPSDSWEDALNPFSNPDPLLIAASYDPPGIDMTLGGAGQTDTDQIVYVLAQSGLTGRVGTIGGLAYLLGTQADDQFVWRRGQSGLSYIESLDAMYGFRTYETTQGTIQRKLTSNLVPPFPTVQYTVQEGPNGDIIAGASIKRDIEQIRNRIEVTGWDDGSGSNAWASVGAASPLPPGIALVSENYSSSLIEKQQGTDLGGGMSCRETADYWLTQLQYPMLEAIVPTWRDDPFEVGDVVYLNAPHLLGVNQAMTLMHLEIEVTPNTFTQTLTLRAQDYSVFRGPPTLPLTLPATLKAGP